jgi:hypothetical protein
MGAIGRQAFIQNQSFYMNPTISKVKKADQVDTIKLSRDLGHPRTQSQAYDRKTLVSACLFPEQSMSDSSKVLVW